MSLVFSKTTSNESLSGDPLRSVQASCSFFFTAAMPASRLAPSALLVRLTVSAAATALKPIRQPAIISVCSLVMASLLVDT
ncbi:hypothetical protein D3C72_2202850 [compost metagenome]